MILIFLQEAPEECLIVLCANKTDIDVSKWKVSREAYTQFAKEQKLKLFESSAAKGHNIDKV